uniref:Somatostatin 1 n=1 Tax=Ophionotus victoriae TaxID=667017 RepID=A0A220W0B4_9ECHI|nr:somatostatin 1 precursor [Ophionotus victoriae]
MKYLNLTTFAALLLAGAVVLVQSAPRRNSLNTWPFEMEEENTAADQFQQSPLLNKLLERIYSQLEDRIGNTNNEYVNSQSRPRLDLEQLTFAAGANDIDEAAIPVRPVKRGKCVGRFVPYMMNC